MINIIEKDGRSWCLEEKLDELDFVDKQEACAYLIEQIKERPFELKRILCNAFNVPNYYDDDALRVALERIVNAR